VGYGSVSRAACSLNRQPYVRNPSPPTEGFMYDEPGVSEQVPRMRVRGLHSCICCESVELRGKGLGFPELILGYCLSDLNSSSCLRRAMLSGSMSCMSTKVRPCNLDSIFPGIGGKRRDNSTGFLRFQSRKLFWLCCWCW